jgi:hypothetical protein
MASIPPFNRRTECQNIKLTFCRRTLEELRTIFDIPTRDHITYRVKVVMPWLAKKYLRLWHKPRTAVGELPEFHDWYRATQQLTSNRLRSQGNTEQPEKQ